MRSEILLPIAFILLMTLKRVDGFTCYVCSGYANECDNFLSAERVEECAALGFDGCVEQTYFSSKEPDDKRIFRYCYNPKPGGFYHNAVAVAYQATSGFNQAGNLSQALAQKQDHVCKLSTVTINGVEFHNQACICTRDNCNIGCEACDMYQGCSQDDDISVTGKASEECQSNHAKSVLECQEQIRILLIVTTISLTFYMQYIVGMF